jgi:glycerophosphoryl diester phosphodiesterase
MAYASSRAGRPVEIIGHRGSPKEQRENTLPSFRRAFSQGANGIELDVHGTKDGAVVVHHDFSTNSRPGDSGTVLSLAESTLAALRAVELGTDKIPTLEEVLSAAPTDAVVYVEVKAQRIEESVIAAIRGGDRSCAVHSFDHRVVRRVHELAPEIPGGVLQTSYPVDPLRPMRDAGARDLWQQWELIDPSLIELVHDQGGRVIAWTVNSSDVVERLIGWGIDGICTDLPGVMRPIADSIAGR